MANLDNITDSDSLGPVYETYAAAGTGISQAYRVLEGIADDHEVGADLRC